MPVITATDRPTFDVGGTRFTSLAVPSSGSSETATWRLQVAPGAPGTPHRVTREEILVAVAGRATVSVDADVHELPAGATLVVPASSTLAVGNPFDTPFEAIAIYPVGGEVVLGDAAPFTPPWAK